MSQEVPKSAKIPDEIDRKIANALITRPQQTDIQLARELNVSRRTVNRKRNSDEVRALVVEALSIPADEMRRLTAKSLRKIEEHVDSDNPRISLAAAMHVTRLAADALGEVIRKDEKEGVSEIVYVTRWGSTDPT